SGALHPPAPVPPPTPRRRLLVSNSTLRRVPGPLAAASQELLRPKMNRVLFIPYTLHYQDAYAKTTREKLESLGYGLDSIHESSDPEEAVRKSEAIFIGGGNTFRLLKALYDNSLFLLQCCFILPDGIPYMGSRAGTNVATISLILGKEPVNPQSDKFPVKLRIPS
uniref:Uncharacterized protein n=1 Tax=Gopherus agassizii TaxID=38772 RepID=A0A452HWL8_9SAUR